MGVPPNHPFLYDFQYKSSSYWGTPITIKTSTKLGSQRVGSGFVAMVKLVEQPKHKGLVTSFVDRIW